MRLFVERVRGSLVYWNSWRSSVKCRWGHPLIFRLASNAFPDIGSVCRIEEKKPRKKEPKINMAEKLVDVIVKLRQRGTNFRQLFFSMLLLCSFIRLKELFKVKNGLTTSLLFFFENVKHLGRSDNAKRRKKRMAWKKFWYLFRPMRWNVRVC